MLRELLDDDFLRYLMQISQKSISKPQTNYGSNFSKFKYDIGNNDKYIFNLIQDKNFQKIMKKLTQKRWRKSIQ